MEQEFTYSETWIRTDCLTLVHQIERQRAVSPHGRTEWSTFIRSGQELLAANELIRETPFEEQRQDQCRSGKTPSIRNQETASEAHQETGDERMEVRVDLIRRRVLPEEWTDVAVRHTDLLF